MGQLLMRLVSCCQCYQLKRLLVLQLAALPLTLQADFLRHLASSVWLLSRRVTPKESCLLDAFQALYLMPHWQPMFDRQASV